METIDIEATTAVYSRYLLSDNFINASAAVYSHPKQNMDTPASLHGTSNKMSVAALINELSRLKGEVSRRLYREYDIIIKSVKDLAENIHVLFIIYCIRKLVSKGEKVTSTSLLDECELLWQTLSEDMRGAIYQNFSEAETSLPPVAAVSRSLASNAGESSSSSALHENSRRPSGSTASDATSSSPVTYSAGGPTVDERPQVSSNVIVAASPTAAAAAPITLDVTDNIRFGEHQHTPIQPLTLGTKLNSQDSTTAPLVGAEGVTTVEDELLPPTAGTEDDVNVSDERPQRSHQADPRHIKECLWAVQYENKILETYKMCTVCKKNPRDITFLPCGHFITCRECAGPIYTCTLCQRAILATIDTYLS